jgi:hypothetical protein
MATPLNLPVAYRLVEKGDGNGNDIPTLEGLFLEYDHIDDKIEGSWRELETQALWHMNNGNPFA